jgi:hypothetical protein
MTKERVAKKTAHSTKTAAEKTHDEPIILDSDQDKALRLVDRSAKVRAELEKAVTLAAAKAVRKVLKDHGISLSPAQTSVLTSIWFTE